MPLWQNSLVMKAKPRRSRARMDQQGRVLIPAEFRKELDMRPGEVLTLLVEGGELKVRSVSAGVRKAQEIAAKHIKREPGADAVDTAMRAGACASTVNIAEAFSRLVDLGFTAQEAETALNALEYVAVDFSAGQANASGSLRLATRQYGLGLGDRACLALAIDLRLPVVTADRIWTQLDVGVEVVLCR